MTERSDTLNLGSLRAGRPETPAAPAQLQQDDQPARHDDRPANHPKVADAARARIAALATGDPKAEYALGSQDIVAPHARPSELVTDKSKLATESKPTTPLVRRRKMPSVIAPLLTALGVFLLVLLLFKAPVIISQVQYSFAPKATPTVAAPVVTEVIPAAATISIPKININVPVIYEPSIQEAAIQRALQDGVVHYGNTAVPGQNGNVAIFGHSSNDWWEPGNYKFVFVLLDKLSPGDQLTIDYQSKRYTYEVTGSKVVEPTDISVLNQTPTPTLSLITCTPPGTSLRRLVVTAKQINPDPNQAQVATTTSQVSASQLPDSKKSFMDQLGQSWNGIFSLFGGAPKPSASPSPGEIPSAK